MSDKKAKCSNRNCGWIGLESEMMNVLVEGGPLKVTELHCPRCDCNSFYYKLKPGEKEKTKSGAQLIMLERHRQLKIEGWSAEHDDEHAAREIASAAHGYLSHYVARAWVFTNEFGMPGIEDGQKRYREEMPPDSWPWDDKYWKPKSPIQDLIRAGALIAAEIDRLQRKAARLCRDIGTTS